MVGWFVERDGGINSPFCRYHPKNGYYGDLKRHGELMP